MTSTEAITPIHPRVLESLPTNLPADAVCYRSDAEIEALLPKVELVADDGQNMESDLHRMAMELLLASIQYFFKGRNDFFAGGNMFIYYSAEQARHRDFKGPDFFLVKNVRRESPRDYWCVWEEEGRYPDVIIEFLSPTTRKADLTTKKEIYEKTFRTGNYFCFDVHTFEFLGWKLERSGYVELIPNQFGQLWCDELNLWIGPWQGVCFDYHRTWLRFFTPEGVVIPIPSEIVESSVRRAEAAEAELANLKALLAEQGKTVGEKAAIDQGRVTNDT